MFSNPHSLQLGLIFSFSILLASQRAWAEELPTAEEVIERYATATLANGDLSKIKNRVISGRESHEAIQVLYRTIIQPPIYHREEGDGTRHEGLVDGIAFKHSEAMGVEIAQGSERERILAKCDLHPMEAIVRVADIEETTTVLTAEKENKQLFVLSGVSIDGSQAELSFDANTDLLEQVKIFESDVVITVEFSDYQNVDGFLFPFVKVIEAEGLYKSTIKIGSIEHNQELDEQQLTLVPRIYSYSLLLLNLHAGPVRVQ